MPVTFEGSHRSFSAMRRIGRGSRESMFSTLAWAPVSWWLAAACSYSV